MTGFARGYKGEMISVVLCGSEAEMPKNCPE